MNVIILFSLVLNLGLVLSKPTKQQHVQQDENQLFNVILNEIRQDYNDQVWTADFEQQLKSQYFGLFDEMKQENIKEDDNLAGDKENIFDKLSHGKADKATCDTCKNIISLGRDVIQSPQALKSVGITYCKSFKFTTNRTCEGIFERFSEPLFYIVKNSQLNVSEICGVFISHKCMAFYNESVTSKLKYDMAIPPTLNVTDQLDIHTAATNKTYKLLHLSDIHIDLQYVPGSESHCNEILCCRNDSQSSNGKFDSKAGYWGDSRYSCDAPKSLVESTLHHIEQFHGKDLDFIIWTGDLMSHNVWSTTKQDVINAVKVFSDLVYKYFPGIQVFPALGNHEAHPVNMFPSLNAPANLSDAWLYDQVYEIWQKWIPENESKASFTKAGFYSKQILPNLKLISLNSNFGYRMNFWNVFNPIDPGNQLSWLINELEQAEKQNNSVMIISHLPPSNECIGSWTHNYIRIVERFKKVIVGHFNGHTHKDEIGVVYSKKQTSNGAVNYPVGAVFMAPSITTYSNLNPAYRIFTLDSRGKPIDYQTYYTKLNEANQKGMNHEPEWQEEYSAKQAYNLESISVESIADLIDRMENDEKLLDKYASYYHRFSTDYLKNNPNHTTLESKKNLIKRCKIVDPFDN